MTYGDIGELVREMEKNPRTVLFATVLSVINALFRANRREKLKEGTQIMTEEKVFINMTNGGPISVYVRDGKIVRVRPLQIPAEEFKPWVIEAGGRKYSPPRAVRLSPPAHAERNRVYSKNRILYPLKRVDFDPNGERNPQNRGKSGYVRISWDEALTIVAGEIKRLTDKYGGADHRHDPSLLLSSQTTGSSATRCGRSPAS
jgi:anaerobic selenocysteine-containing dehydrogenase